MPNGDPDWRKKELPKLKVFFKRIAPVLKKFAKDHNLKIGKYYHQGPDWDFRFRHPEGGVASICVRRKDDDHVLIHISWHIDYYEANRRDYKYEEGKEVSLEPQKLREMLKEAFSSVLSWKKEDLENGTPNNTWKDTWTKEEFEHLNEKYPIPKLD